ncbi:MAG: hypothetical protein IT379_31930 [Deltaproteobacteria bacterium]|nr:hypothetical protein [Deltaproteobacteria bacterium]
MRAIRHLGMIGPIACIVFGVAACGDDSPSDDCGVGTGSDYGGARHCLYRAGITEEGFTCPASLPNHFELDGFEVCSESMELPAGAEEEFREDLGLEDPDASSGDAGVTADSSMPPDSSTPTDSGPSPDSGSESCWDGWAMPVSRTEAAARPASPNMRLGFRYAEDAMGRGEIVLEDILERTVISPEDGPFMVGVHSGSWVELRDASDRTLFTRGIFELIPESLEVPPPPDGDGGFMRVPTCPDPGFIFVEVENDPAATHVVFFAEPLDGITTSELSREIARFTLPE